MGRRRFFVLGDLHSPWHHKPALKAAVARCINFKPDAIVQIGDFFDMLSYTRFARSQNFITPHQEQIEARGMAEKFWQGLQSACRGAKFYQLVGNHEARIIKRIMDKAPEYEFAVMDALEDMVTFRGVKTIIDPREELIIDDVTFIHGYHSRLGDHMMESHENICCGHTHRGGTVFHPWDGEMKWELNAGFLGDKSASPLSYTQRKRFSKWTLGWGEIDAEGPRFVPFKK